MKKIDSFRDKGLRQKMIERLKFDIIYIENLSIFSDIKVLAYTLIIVLQGRGK